MLGTASGAKYGYGKDGKPLLTKERKLLLNDNNGKYAQTFLEYPPMQEGASFNMSALKAELEKKMEQVQSAPSK